ncbi:helix-turn-helix transcriptional regulator [Mesorhizobium sp.]|uniref:helix-turn-helix domain-containing protein n=1 Tax=Mesorhizobium sp. TaxID=1871066 RepID=UPI000FE647D9|nr:helix-turn-helix transcriptional regulator [Mesorhizobium sp.]RWB67589.1 MAG: XRE family transcriptional regulator [Mesorhizobium sp.]
METAVHQLTAWLDRPNAPPRSAFAAKIGIARQVLWRYENGRMPKRAILEKIVVETDGAVTANAWLGKEAADVVSTRPTAA